MVRQCWPRKREAPRARLAKDDVARVGVVAGPAALLPDEAHDLAAHIWPVRASMLHCNTHTSFTLLI